MFATMPLSKLKIVIVTAELIGVVLSNTYDVVMPQYASSCKNGCLPWASAGGSNATYQKFIDSLFVDTGTVTTAANSCAMPGAHAGLNERDGSEQDGMRYILDSYEGQQSHFLLGNVKILFLLLKFLEITFVCLFFPFD